jgi:hypothetical protein
MSKRQYKNFVILHKEIFEKKNNKVGKNKFYNKQKRVKNCVSKYLKLWNSMFEFPSSSLLTISKFMKKFPLF